MFISLVRPLVLYYLTSVRLQVPILALWRLGRGGDRRQAAHRSRQTSLHALERSARVLGGAARESVCKVSCQLAVFFYCPQNPDRAEPPFIDSHKRLYGTYENLHAGFTTKALQDLTGGIVQVFIKFGGDFSYLARGAFFNDFVFV